MQQDPRPEFGFSDVGPAFSRSPLYLGCQGILATCSVCVVRMSNLPWVEILIRDYPVWIIFARINGILFRDRADLIISSVCCKKNEIWTEHQRTMLAGLPQENRCSVRASVPCSATLSCIWKSRHFLEDFMGWYNIIILFTANAPKSGLLGLFSCDSLYCSGTKN